MTSIFDPQQFFDSTTTEAAEKRDNLPTTREYIATIDDISGRSVQGKKDPNQTYLFFDYPMTINLKDEYPEIARQVGIDKLTLRYGCGVDLTEGGAIDWSKGRNNGLRMLREATGTNVAGEAWSPRTLVGRRIRVTLKLREYPEGSGNMVEDIKSIAKV